jgi:hypothetical protein
MSHMLSYNHSRAGSTIFLVISMLAAWAGLPPAAASARMLRESSASAPAASGAGPASTTNPGLATESLGESGVNTAREERRAQREQLREERRALREERRERSRVRPAAHDGAGCSVELQAPAPVAAGDPVSFLGTLSCPAAADAADRTVILYEQPARASEFTVAGTTTTEANGSFQFSASASDGVFYAVADGAKSKRARVKIDPIVVLAAPAAGTPLFTGAAPAHAADTAAGGAVTFSGTIRPAWADAVVALQRQDSVTGRWYQIATGHSGTQGEYSIAHTFHSPGDASIRVVAHYRGLDMAAASEPSTYQISRRQHEQLTIWASSDTIVYGQPVTISGIVAGAADQPVTLLAQTPAGGFEPVAQATTGHGGEYSFVESPLENTRYRVTSGAARSVVLSESVAYALTAEPSALTVRSGQQLTFSGSVTPAQTGQTIYLERQDPSGVGFHVVAAGALGSDNSYSIAYAFSGGTRTEPMRISVPADAHNRATFGTSFGIEVISESATGALVGSEADAETEES